MTITEIEIDTCSLDRDAGAMTEKLARVEREVDGMFEAVRELDRMWDGPANQAFVQMFRRDYETMQELCGALRTLTGCMAAAGRAYGRGENTVGSVVSSIRI